MFETEKDFLWCLVLLLPHNILPSVIKWPTLLQNTGENLQMEDTVSVLELTVSNLQANKSKDPTVSITSRNGAGTLGSTFLVN